MKLYRVLTLAVVTALSASFFSCSDDDDDDNGKFDTTYLPGTVTEKEGSNENTYTFSYDNDNRLTGWEGKYEKYTITYGTDGKITKLYSEEGSYYTSTLYYTYKGNEITVTNEDEEINEVITINNNGTVASIKDGYDNSIVKFSYSGKNMTRFEYKREKEEGIFTEKGSAKYDGKAGIFRNVNTPQWFLYTQLDSDLAVTAGNNPTSSEFTEYFQGIKYYSSTSTYTYVYNDDSFPVSLIATHKWTSLGEEAKVSAKLNKRALRSTSDDDSGTSATSYSISYIKK